jgi:hypothetical protein
MPARETSWQKLIFCQKGETELSSQKLKRQKIESLNM